MNLKLSTFGCNTCNNNNNDNKMNNDHTVADDDDDVADDNNNNNNCNGSYKDCLSSSTKTSRDNGKSKPTIIHTQNTKYKLNLNIDSESINCNGDNQWVIPQMILYDLDYVDNCNENVLTTTTTTCDERNKPAATCAIQDLTTTSTINIDGKLFEEYSLAVHMWTVERFEMYLFEIVQNDVVAALDRLLFGEYSTSCWSLHLMEYNFYNLTCKYLLQQILNCYTCETLKFHIQIDGCRVSIKPFV